MPAELRTRLLEAAEQEIAEKGLANASLRSIARRCDVSHQATAHHFGDRAGLFTALAVRGSEILYDLTAVAVDSVGPEDGQQVAAGCAAYVEFAQRHPALFDVMARPELIRFDDPELVAVRTRHTELSQRVIEDAQRRGWGPDLSTEEATAVCWATAHGLAVLQRDELMWLFFPGLDVTATLRKLARAFTAGR